jgi:hypothetical protein
MPDMQENRDRLVVPAELARVGRARHFISWRAAVAGLRGESLHEVAVAAEAALTDILLSREEGELEITAEEEAGFLHVRISHAELPERRMRDLPRLLEHYLDGYRLSPSSTVLTKRLN